MEISEYIKKSTGFTSEELTKMSVSDWLNYIRDKSDDDYTVKNPRLLAPRGSIIAYLGRFIPFSFFENYINKI